jgi:single-strand DNA-binding protein
MSDPTQTPTNTPASKPWNDMNHFKCRARVGNKPELRATKKSSVVNCTLYIKNEYDDANNKRVTKTTRVPLTMFGDKGMALANEVGKGDYIEVEGRIEEETWADEATGHKRSRLKLIASKYQVIQCKGEQQQAA